MSATRPWPGNRSRPRFVVGAGCCGCWLLWGCVCRWAAARPVSDVACCLWPHGCSGCRRVRPPARSPHASLRLGVVDLEAWPSSAAAHRHLGPAPRATRASRFPPCVNLRLGVVDLEAWPSPPDPPVPSTPVGLFIAVHIPSRPRRQAPQSGLSCPAARASPSTPAVPGVLVGDRRRFEARPGPAAAHRHPPHRWGFSLLCTSHPGLAAHGHRRQAPQPGLSCPAAHALPSTPAVPGVLVVIGVVLKPGYALPPPTGTHRHRGQAPRASRCPQQRAVPGVLVGDRRRFEARPGPAPAHRHRSWAPAGGCMPCVGFQSGPLGVQH